uniref:Phospholipid scramblase n=1 Tax=Glossina morsitans morsitans TaxID=37546 RepID=A0A1B0FMG1_GLOMM
MMPMNNINQGGYVPPGYGSEYPTAPPSHAYNMPNTLPMNHGFGQQHGYAPLPQMPYSREMNQPHDYTQQQIPQPPGMQQFYNNGVSGQFQPGYGQLPAPIVTQPGVQPPVQSGDWMIMPAGIPNCPRGLEYLTTVDQLLVKQKVELLEAFTGFETNNKFSIKNALGQKVYYAVEENDCCTRNMCGPSRPFDMKIFDNYRNEVIHMHRPLACSSCLCMCCLQSIEVSAPPGNVIGSVEQEWSICAPSFRIKNQLDEVVLRIEGPICTFSICGDVEFNIMSLTGENIGKISKQWSGLAREIFTDADFFGITFPLDLDVRMKAVLLGATFLIVI